MIVNTIPPYIDENFHQYQHFDCLVIVASGTEPPYSWKFGLFLLHSVVLQEYYWWRFSYDDDDDLLPLCLISFEYDNNHAVEDG